MPRSAESVQHTVSICSGSDCRKKGSRELRDLARRALKKLGLAEHSLVVETKCCGLCKQAPLACVDGGEWISKAKPKTLKREIARATLHRPHRVA